MNVIADDQIAAARAYEALHVPALFGQWCEPVLDAAGVEPGARVLDVACGTGVLGREARLRVGSPGYVAGADPDLGMLTVARELGPEIDWRQAVAESLPWPNHSFDAVVSQFGLMFFTDRIQALREMLRVLAPGGRIAIAVWDVLENSPAYPLEVGILERIGGRRAADALRAPFVLGDTAELHGLFASAGAASIDIRTHTGTARFPSIRVMVEADLRGWLPVMGVELEEEQIRRILDQAETALREHTSTGGQVAFDAPAHIVTATKSRDTRG